MMNMKIILLHYTAPPVVGGVETVLARQARQLSRAGHQVKILAGRGQAWDANIPVETVNLLDTRHPQVLRTKSALDSGNIPPEFSEQVEQTEAELRRAISGSQVVIAHNVASLNKNLALTAALYNLSQEKHAPRLVLWHHDLAWATDRYLPELHNGWPWDLLRTAWPGVKQVTVSEIRRQELAALVGLPLRQITVVPGGLSLDDFLGLPPHLVRLADDLHLTLAAPILVCPVRITRRKNLELAMETLAELRKHMPHAVLIVTGQPGNQGKTYFDQLMRLRNEMGLEGCAFFLAERFPEGLSETGLIGFYRMADALLITSREEGFGVPLLEAGLAGIPIFCSELEALKALAGENATYFDPQESPKQIAGLIAGRLRGDPVYRMRVRVRHDFTWEAIYRKQLAPLLDS
jgi:glycosyltransferase involved in cell wall biosynthesis